MYEMSKAELQQYLYSETRYKELCKQQALELKRAYADIHPTRTGYDYGQGKIYSESINVADYAIYLIDLKADFKRHQEWWFKRVCVYRKAFSRLSVEDQKVFMGYRIIHFNFLEHDRVLNDLFDHIEKIVNTIQELHRKPLVVIHEELDDENLNDEDYLSDYVNYIEDDDEFSGVAHGKFA